MTSTRKEVSEKHREIAAQIIADYGHDLEGLMSGAITAALAKVERDTFKRAAEIAGERATKSRYHVAKLGGDAYWQGSASSAEIVRSTILSEAGESE